MISVLGNLAWVGANYAGSRRFERSLKDCESVQRDLLRRYLSTNGETAYGRDQGFDKLASAEAFRDQVPLVTYDDLEGWIDRIATGETGVLTHEPVLLFEPSSGSTRAAKRIPYTAGLQAEIRAAVAPWMWDLYTRWPALLRGPAYWSISPVARRQEPGESVIPLGFEEDSAYLGGIFQGLLDQVLAVPGEVRRVEDIAAFRRVTLLYLLSRPDLRLISVWHPTFLLALLRVMVRDWDELLADLHRGFKIESLGVEVVADPKRAKKLADRDPATVEEVWPELGVVSCWGDAHARHAADELRARLPGITVQSKGLIATEGFVTIPYQERPVLAVTSHVFEFLEPGGATRFAWEVEEGVEYSVVLTTSGGLYRYRLRDRVRITGFLGTTPCLEFLGKEDHISDLRGEKLSAGFVGDALGDVLGPLRPCFAMLAPDVEPRTPGYVLYLETKSMRPESPAGDEGLTAQLEARLRDNPHYAYAVDLEQLQPVRVRYIQRGYEQYADHLVERGQRLGDVKPSPLSSLMNWGEVFDGRGRG